MPELPEVEQFRTLLEPLMSQNDTLVLERHVESDKSPPRKFLSDEDINEINQSKYYVTDVIRKGKLICMVLNASSSSESISKNQMKKYMFVHMGMTGFICNKSKQPKLQEVKHTPEQYPPPHTHLKFTAGSYEVCFVDQRKFGSITLQDSMEEEYDSLAPDAWKDLMLKNTTDIDPIIKQNLIEQSLGIKGLLLDQKRAVSGVGNYLADEVLYQVRMHPDQKYLTAHQSNELLRKLHSILETANQCLQNDTEFPKEWLFHYRWTKKRGNAEDAKGRSIKFITSGGRTSAIVPSVQKLIKNQPPSSTSSKSSNGTNTSSKLKQNSRKRKDISPCISGADITSVPSTQTSEEASSKKVRTATSCRRSARLSTLS
jgi:formamidopyrimidine-DNA glycosylase